MVHFIWNPAEHRFRCFVRIFFHTIVLLIMTGFSDVVYTFITDHLPVFSWNYSFFIFIMSSFIILSIWFAVRFFDKRPLMELGLHFNRLWYIDLVFGLMLGAILMSAIFFIELLSGWITVSAIQPDIRSLLQALFMFSAVGFYEELLSRGYHLKNLSEGIPDKFLGKRGSTIVAWIISSLIFGSMHAINPNSSWISICNIAIAGLFLGFGMLLTGELGISIGIHITWNFFQGSIFGFPVSGSSSTQSFINIIQSGPVHWTGGSFGPEAGLLGLLASILGILIIIFWVKWQHGHIKIAQELAEYSKG